MMDTKLLIHKVLFFFIKGWFPNTSFSFKGRNPDDPKDQENDELEKKNTTEGKGSILAMVKHLH